MLFRRIRCKEYRRAVGTHYGPTRRYQAGYSPRHRRAGRAGTLILCHLRIRRTKAPLGDDYGPARSCWSMGNAAAPARAVGPFTGLRAGLSSGRRRRAAGAAGPSRDFQGLRAGPEQRTPTRTPPGPQYLSRDYGPDESAERLCRSTTRQADTRPRDLSGAGRRVSLMLGIRS